MLTTMTLLATLSLALGQAGDLTVTNVRNTYGVLGPKRPDSKFLPGDTFVLSFDIKGAQVDAAGKVLYSIGLEASNSDGKVLFKQAPRDLEAKMKAGAESLPACAKIQIGMEVPPGDYTVKVTVKDRAGQTSREVTKTCEVLPKGFGLVRLALTRDEDAKVAAPFFQLGKAAYINFSAVGFGRDQGSKQPQLNVEMRVLDEKGQPAADQPVTGDVTQGVPEKAAAHPMQFQLQLNRTGTYTIELKAKDKITGESAKLSFPVTAKKGEK